MVLIGSISFLEPAEVPKDFLYCTNQISGIFLTLKNQSPGIFSTLSNPCWSYSFRSKWCSMLRSRTNSKGEIPNIILVNRNNTVSSISRSLIQWNLKVSLKPSLILIGRKTCFKSPVIATALKRHRISTFQSVLCNTGPTSKYSFKDGPVFLGLADASCKIRSLVVLADCFTASFCGMQKSSDVVVRAASSTISSAICSFIFSSYSWKSAGWRCSFQSRLDKPARLPFLLLRKVGWFRFHGNQVWYQSYVFR